ncbi:MAG: hypothetical protein MZW92_46215 [Comamonadaceae bacterium]|nr:hypothetical protein [Comamonadaceae bacterium]
MDDQLDGGGEEPRLPRDRPGRERSTARCANCASCATWCSMPTAIVPAPPSATTAARRSAPGSRFGIAASLVLAFGTRARPADRRLRRRAGRDGAGRRWPARRRRAGRPRSRHADPTSRDSRCRPARAGSRARSAATSRRHGGRDRRERYPQQGDRAHRRRQAGASRAGAGRHREPAALLPRQPRDRARRGGDSTAADSSLVRGRYQRVRRAHRPAAEGITTTSRSPPARTPSSGLQQEQGVADPAAAGRDRHRLGRGGDHAPPEPGDGPICRSDHNNHCRTTTSTGGH